MEFDSVNFQIGSSDEKYFYSKNINLLKTNELIRVKRNKTTESWKQGDFVTFIVMSKTRKEDKNGISITYVPLRNLKDKPSKKEIEERIERAKNLITELNEKKFYSSSGSGNSVLKKEISFFKENGYSEFSDSIREALSKPIENEIIRNIRTMLEWLQENIGTGSVRYNEIKKLSSSLKELGFDEKARITSQIATEIYEQGVISDRFGSTQELQKKIEDALIFTRLPFDKALKMLATVFNIKENSRIVANNTAYIVESFMLARRNKL